MNYLLLNFRSSKINTFHKNRIQIFGKFIAININVWWKRCSTYSEHFYYSHLEWCSYTIMHSKAQSIEANSHPECETMIFANIVWMWRKKSIQDDVEWKACKPLLLYVLIFIFNQVNNCDGWEWKCCLHVGISFHIVMILSFST